MQHAPLLVSVCVAMHGWNGCIHGPQVFDWPVILKYKLIAALQDFLLDNCSISTN